MMMMMSEYRSNHYDELLRRREIPWLQYSIALRQDIWPLWFGEHELNTPASQLRLWNKRTLRRRHQKSYLDNQVLRRIYCHSRFLPRANLILECRHLLFGRDKSRKICHGGNHRRTMPKLVL